jgi:hypothetical protein
VCTGSLGTDYVCSDGSACTGTDLCASGVCSSGPSANCDDGNPCTDDVCDAVLGCGHASNALSCDDGDACTSGDACVAGDCVGTGTCACPDADTDGYVDCGIPGCQPGALTCGDCDDGDPAVHPGATETCNQRDDDCDGRADDGSATTWSGRKITQSPPVAGERFGQGVLPLGDVNQDGVIDVAMGRPAEDTPYGVDGGAVDIISGASGSLLCRAVDPANTHGERLGRALAAMGDLTGDGIPDLVAGAHMKVTFISGADCSLIKSCTDSFFSIFESSPGSEFKTAVQLYQSLGTSVAAVGDLNRDGIPDVLAGDPDARFRNTAVDFPATGRAVVLSGANCSPLFRFAPVSERARFGTTLALIGDVNLDGTDDMAIGAPQIGRDRGFIQIYSGANGALLRTIVDGFGVLGTGGLGSWVDGGMDVTGDGIPDLLATETAFNLDGTTGFVMAVISGSNGAVVRRCPRTTPDTGLDNPTFIGDLTGDGISEITAGAGRRDTTVGMDAGEIEILSGSDCSVVQRIRDDAGGEAGQLLGGARPAGDLNGDGRTDLIAGVPFDDEAGAVDAGSIIFFTSESDCDADGTGPSSGDCNDGDPAIAPGHSELCDGKDNDCDGMVDEGLDLTDSDGDAVVNCSDNCPEIFNPGQEDADSDGRGDVCDACISDPSNDADGDGLCCGADNCCTVANPAQEDADADGAGDACDPCPSDPSDDADRDGHCADVDNCPFIANPGQEDLDADHAGDACDPCPSDPSDDADRDGRCADLDNCPLVGNPGQEDIDADDVGDACDNCPTAVNVDQNPCACGECFPIDISIQTDLDRSGLLRWTTGLEHDIRGFNVVLIDNRGVAVRQNPALIPCIHCVTDLGADYVYLIPKHRSGRNVYVEQVHLDGRTQLYGPAVKQ